MRHRPLRSILAILATALAVLVFVDVGRSFITKGSAPTVEITDLGSKKYKVRNRNYKTLDMMTSQYAGAGIKVDDLVVESVDTADLVEAGTDTSVGYSFTENTTVAAEFELNDALVSSWTGFLAQSPGTAADVDVDLVFTVTATAGASSAQVQAALLAGKVGSDEANSDGTLTGNSLLIFTPSGSSCTNCGGGGGGPAADLEWLLALGVTTIVFGLLFLRRRPAGAAPA